MIEKINLNNILFLDIETVPEVADFNTLDDEMKALWDHKTLYQRKDDFTPEEFYDRAGIWAEFGKIVCISVGYFIIKGDIRNFRVTSFFGEEKQLLKDFSNLINNHFNQPQHVLCGHNAKEFDIPFLARRMIINQMPIPSSKDDIDGSQVGHVFYVEKDIDRIVTYCEKDTIAVAQIFLRLRREDLLIEEEIIHV